MSTPTDTELLDLLRDHVQRVIDSFDLTKTLIHPGNAKSWTGLCELLHDIPSIQGTRERQRERMEAKARYAATVDAGIAPGGDPMHLGYKGLSGPRVYPCLCGATPKTTTGSWRRVVAYNEHDQPICAVCEAPMVFVTSEDKAIYDAMHEQEGS
jgi:hypothetical protein